MGWFDYPDDVGCFAATGGTESPQCSDGFDNDGDGLTDFDGGQSIHTACSGGACPPGVSDPDTDGVADPDPQCVDRPWRNNERPNRRCGLGFELGLILPLISALARRCRFGRYTHSRDRSGAAGPGVAAPGL